MNIFTKKVSRKEGGFSLIEIMVAMSIFMVVMVISSGSIISIFGANQKSKSLRSVMDNLNISMEGMTRNIRFGTNYHCGLSTPVTEPADCGGGDSTIHLLTEDGRQVKYWLLGNRIMRTINSEDSPVTSSDVTITRLTFFVFGSNPLPNTSQARVIIVINGEVGIKEETKSRFSLQTTVSQREIDL